MQTKFILSVLVFSLTSIASAWIIPLRDQNPTFERKTGEYVLSFKTANKVTSISQIASDYPEATEIILSKNTKDGFETLVLLSPTKGLRGTDLQSYSRQSNTLWIEENIAVEGDAKESTYEGTVQDLAIELFSDNDPLFSDQGHHILTQSASAWAVSQGEGVVVAITDNGIDTSHPDLLEAIWVNQKEIADNGIDDDNNGYIDDVNGWDFCKNDPGPNGQRHGTHVAGIVAATLDNNLGGVGAAPKAKVMNLNWGRCFNAAKVAKAYAYAVDNGAKVVTTSYNVDRLATNRVYIAAINYIQEKGALLFNSAGNGNLDNSARTQNDQVIYVAATEIRTDKPDAKASFSSFGTKVDISAPGVSILSTLPGKKYGPMSGTSMASPGVAGLAALIWSNNPSWSKEQVAAKIYQSADDVTEKNLAKYKYKLGPGRVNFLKSVQEETTPPTFVGLLEVLQNQTGRATRELNLKSYSLFDANAIKTTSYELVKIDADGERDVDFNITNKTYMVGTNVITLKLQSALQPGKYRFTAFADSLEDPFGQRLDGNGDAEEGDDFVQEFTVQ